MGPGRTYPVPPATASLGPAMRPAVGIEPDGGGFAGGSIGDLCELSQFSGQTLYFDELEPGTLRHDTFLGGSCS